MTGAQETSAARSGASDGFEAGAEFDRQVRTLVTKGYPALAGLTEEAFTGLLAPLRSGIVERGATMEPPTEARVPFVLVVSRRLVAADRTMALTELRGKAGFADFEPDDLARFDAVDGVDIPGGEVYAVLDVDRGREMLNRTPDDAMAVITAQGRTPITVDEGIAFITQFPDSLRKNNCFSLVASRCGDRRVPALWISKGAPKLGWCWAGNPHTWLGSASCAGRWGATSGPAS